VGIKYIISLKNIVYLSFLHIIFERITDCELDFVYFELNLSRIKHERGELEHEIADSKHDLTDVEQNICKVELDGGCSGHDFGNVGLDFNDFELNIL